MTVMSESMIPYEKRSKIAAIRAGWYIDETGKFSSNGDNWTKRYISLSTQNSNSWSILCASEGIKVPDFLNPMTKDRLATSSDTTLVTSKEIADMFRHSWSILEGEKE